MRKQISCFATCVFLAIGWQAITPSFAQMGPMQKNVCGSQAILKTKGFQTLSDQTKRTMSLVPVGLLGGHSKFIGDSIYIVPQSTIVVNWTGQIYELAQDANGQHLTIKIDCPDDADVFFSTTVDVPNPAQGLMPGESDARVLQDTFKDLKTSDYVMLDGTLSLGTGMPMSPILKDNGITFAVNITLIRKNDLPVVDFQPG